MPALRMQDLQLEANKSREKFEAAAMRFAELGRHGDAAWAWEMADYCRWRGDRLERIRQGAPLPMPTFAEWRARPADPARPPAVVQATLLC